MPFPLPEDFKPGTPLCDLITTEIMKTVTGILNHLTVEVRDGVDYPYIEKTARPGEQQPWVIVLPSQSATGPELANTTPLPNAATGSEGIAETASRSDHAHPAQPSLGTLLDPGNSGISTAKTATAWLATNTNKQPIKIWRHRFYYDGTSGSEKLVGVQHYEIINPITGGIVEIGSESTYTIHTPEYWT